MIEFSDALEQNLDLSEARRISLMVPVSFTVMGEAVSRRALNLLNDNRSVLADMWRNIKGDNEEKLARWKQWEGVMKFS